jgi:hypothetical protein
MLGCHNQQLQDPAPHCSYRCGVGRLGSGRLVGVVPAVSSFMDSVPQVGTEDMRPRKRDREIQVHA